jgi:hypothetical protein
LTRGPAKVSVPDLLAVGVLAENLAAPAVLLVIFLRAFALKTQEALSENLD